MTTFTLSPRKAGIVLGILAVVMSALAVTGDMLERTFDDAPEREDGNPYIWPFARQFNFVQEGNIANFYQGLQLVLAAVLLLVIWRGKAQRREPQRSQWFVLGMIFIFLGVDEVAQIHETTIANTIAALRGKESDKTGWFWIYLPVLAAFGLYFIPFLRRLPRRIATLFVLSGSLYIGGAIVMEKFCNWFAKKYGDGLGYLFLDNFSEFMESAGIALFIYTLLLYLATTGEDVRFQFVQSPDPGRKDG